MLTGRAMTRSRTGGSIWRKRRCGRRECCPRVLSLWRRRRRLLRHRVLVASQDLLHPLLEPVAEAQAELPLRLLRRRLVLQVADLRGLLAGEEDLVEARG